MNKKLSVILVALAVGAPMVNGSTIPPGLKRHAAFIFQNDGTNSLPIGTCFSVGVPNSKSTNGGHFQYLVTAKHVLVDTNGLMRSNLWVRVNRWKGGTEMLPLHTDKFMRPLFVHTNGSVDLAVVDWAPAQEEFDFPFLSIDLLAGRDAVSSGKLAEGDDVFFPGLFVNYYGNSNNVPVVRFGRVSILPIEPIHWGREKCELYLIESTCFGGNSGSPVFVRYSVDRDGGLRLGGGELFVAGVLIGYFNDLQPLRWVDVAAVPVNANNSGISAVVPAYLIRDILYLPELKRLRGE